MGVPAGDTERKKAVPGVRSSLYVRKVGHQNIEGNLGFFETLPENGPAVPPGDHDDEKEDGDAHRKPTAVKELEQVGAEIGKIEAEEHAGKQQGLPQRPTPDVAGDVKVDQRTDAHGAGHRNTIGCGQIARFFEGQRQTQAADHHHGVDPGHVDLALGFARSVDDAQPGAVADLNGLLHQGKHAGDHGLGGNNRGDGGQGHHGIQEHPGHQPIKRMDGRLRIFQHEGGLPEIVEQEGGKDQNDPGEADGAAPEMAHVGIQSLTARDAEHHGAKHHDAVQVIDDKEIHGMARVQGRQNSRRPQYLHQAQGGQGEEPKDHDGAENLADALRSLALDEKEAQQDAAGNGQDKRLGRRGGHIQALHGREHGDDRGDQPFAAQEGGAKDGQEHQQVYPARGDALAAPCSKTTRPGRKSRPPHGCRPSG